MKKYILSVLVVLSLGVIIAGQRAFPSEDQGNASSEAQRALYLQRIAEWRAGISAIFLELGHSSVIGVDRLRRMVEVSRKSLVPLGPKVLPYLIVLVWDNHLIGAPIGGISKFLPHNVVLSRKPGEPLSTTEEFPEVVEKNLRYDARKIWLVWWLEGGKRTPQWFSERYSKWLELRKQGKATEAEEMYRKILHIGISAIPLWIEKLKVETDAEVKRAILEALAYLTDGEVQTTWTIDECLKWWQTNKERWTIPFPKTREEFIHWIWAEMRKENPKWFSDALLTTLNVLQ